MTPTMEKKMYGIAHQAKCGTGVLCFVAAIMEEMIVMSHASWATKSVNVDATA